jgi:hypothetical protein
MDTRVNVGGQHRWNLPPSQGHTQGHTQRRGKPKWLEVCEPGLQPHERVCLLVNLCVRIRLPQNKSTAGGGCSVGGAQSCSARVLRARAFRRTPGYRGRASRGPPQLTASNALSSGGPRTINHGPAGVESPGALPSGSSTACKCEPARCCGMMAEQTVRTKRPTARALVHKPAPRGRQSTLVGKVVKQRAVPARSRARPTCRLRRRPHTRGRALPGSAWEHNRSVQHSRW